MPGSFSSGSDTQITLNAVTIGTDTTLTPSTPVNLTASPATLTFFSDAVCTTATTSVVIAAAGSVQSFYFRSTTAGATCASAGRVCSRSNMKSAPASAALTAPTPPSTSNVIAAATTCRVGAVLGIRTQ